MKLVNLGSQSVLRTAVALVLSLGAVGAQATTAPRLVPGDDGPLVRLAEIELSDGRIVQFVGMPTSAEVFYGETADAGAGEAALSDFPPASALERFLELTPDTLPIPRLLVEIAEFTVAPTTFEGDGTGPSEGRPMVSAVTLRNQQIEAQIKRRGLVDQLPETLQVTVPTSDTKSPANAGGSCGDDGKNYFEDHHCDTLGPYGYGVGEGYCDSGKTPWIQRTSNKTMRHTYTRIAACGTYGKVTHKFHSGNSWTTQFSAIGAPNTVTDWYSYKRGIAHWRRANFERLNGVGGVRGWTHFFKQVTD